MNLSEAVVTTVTPNSPHPAFNNDALEVHSGDGKNANNVYSRKGERGTTMPFRKPRNGSDSDPEPSVEPEHTNA